MITPLVTVDGLSFGYDGGKILSGVSFTIGKGESWAVIGKNGAGKSTLVKCLARLLKTPRGCISINGRELHEYSPRELAVVVSYVPQPTGRSLPGYTVYDYVMMGRFPYQGFMASASAHDHEVVRNALDLTDTAGFSSRPIDTLSGGEVQRVFLAGAVAQQTQLLLLDEPASFLDPLHQEMIRKALNRIHDELGTTILTVTHDINTALLAHSHVFALVDGTGFFSGTTPELRKRCPAVLTEIFSLPFETAVCEKTGRRVIMPEVAV